MHIYYTSFCESHLDILYFHFAGITGCFLIHLIAVSVFYHNNHPKLPWVFSFSSSIPNYYLKYLGLETLTFSRLDCLLLY